MRFELNRGRSSLVRAAELDCDYSGMLALDTTMSKYSGTVIKQQDWVPRRSLVVPPEVVTFNGFT